MKGQRQKPEAHGLGYKVRLLSQLTARWITAKLSPHGLTPYHWFVLRELWSEDGLPVSAITERLQEVGGTMTGVLDRMEERDLIRRVRDANDRRVWRVSLTARGEELKATLPSLLNKDRKKLTKGIAQNDLDTFNEVLEQLIDNAQELLSEMQENN